MRAAVVALAAVALAACEKPDDGVSLGWHPLAVGQRIEVTYHTETSMLSVPGSSKRDQVVRFEILGVDGDRASRVRFTSVSDHHVVAGKDVPAVVGSFDAVRSGDKIAITKPSGEPSDRERTEVGRAVAAVFDTMQLQRGFFMHRFSAGERYVPTADERKGLGIGDNARVGMTLVRHDDAGVVIGLDGEGRLEPPQNGYARGLLTGRFESSTDQKRLRVVADTEMFDGNGQKIGRAHFDSLQVRVSD